MDPSDQTSSAAHISPSGTVEQLEVRCGPGTTASQLQHLLLQSLSSRPGEGHHSQLATGLPTHDTTLASVTSLTIWNMSLPHLCLDMLARVLPNLKSLNVHGLICSPGTVAHRPFEAPFTRSLPNITHLTATLGPGTCGRALSTELVCQLQLLPSLTSVLMDARLLVELPEVVLGQLTQLEVRATVLPSPKAVDTLKLCKSARSFRLLTAGPHDACLWMTHVPTCLPLLTSLHLTSSLSDEILPSVLRLATLTSLTALGVSRLSRDYSQSPCMWQRLRFSMGCDSRLTKLPLSALLHPIECAYLVFHVTTHAFEYPALWKAEPYLRKCGGIHVEGSPRVLLAKIGRPPEVGVPQQQHQAYVVSLLRQWARHLAAPPQVVEVRTLYESQLLQGLVSQLWPDAVVRVTG